METIEKYIVPLLLSNVVFGLALFGAVKRPMFARVFFVVGFIGAGVFNIWTAIHNPQAYLTYADVTPVIQYRDFISGLFSRHLGEFVIAIAIGQLLIGLGLILNKVWVRLACIGGILFGVAIAPLGIGSGFPSTLTMAVAFYLLLIRSHDFIWRWNQYSNKT